MKKPIVEFISKYVEKDTIRLHVPGHKGKNSPLEKMDITEIDGADSLYFSDGIIRES